MRLPSTWGLRRGFRLRDIARAMSQENVELVRAMLEAIGPDTDTDDWIDEFCDPEIEWHDTPTFPEAGVHRGREAFRRHAAEFEYAWSDWGVEIEDIRPAEGRVVARIRYGGVGKLSGARTTGDLSLPATGAISNFEQVAFFAYCSSTRTTRPSKPWGCRSKTLTPTPDLSPTKAAQSGFWFVPAGHRATFAHWEEGIHPPLARETLAGQAGVFLFTTQESGCAEQLG